MVGGVTCVTLAGDGGLDNPPPLPLTGTLLGPPLPNAPLSAPECVGLALYLVLDDLDLLLPDLVLPVAGDGGFDSIRAKGLANCTIVPGRDKIAGNGTEGSLGNQTKTDGRPGTQKMESVIEPGLRMHPTNK